MLKNTRTRELIKNLLNETNEPLSASDIYEKLKKDNITLSSIYRTLDTFHNNKIISKMVTPEGVSKYSISSIEHKHYLECKKCHKSTTINFCPYHQADEHIKDTTDFQVEEHNTIIYGICKDCNKNNK